MASAKSRYATDEVFREAHKAKCRERQRRRYAEDAVFRERQKATARETQHRLWAQSDAAYRAKMAEHVRRSAAKRMADPERAALMREYKRLWLRNRLATDPDYLGRTRRVWAKWKRAVDPEYRARVNASHREYDRARRAAQFFAEFHTLKEQLQAHVNRIADSDIAR